ncbi:hypothetical protein E1281_12165 [Actinomadura sp. KC345]|uniref:hypothetical protein n=1 Tax=Actinomadura sp. KC345 TaxID=2530371 RepID=UPI00104DAF9C|nr:hypothetical protein [Actinomadura sp. KC345]TDC55474.1 hypothetical protein E1281_12165 [Actinomadura sp. KC345]
MRRRALTWGGGIVAVAAAAGLGWHFAAVGLDRADKLASVIGAFVGLTALGVAVYGALSGGGPGGRPGPGQHVGRTRVGGSVTQVRGVAGSVRTGGASAPPVPAQAPGGPVPVPESGGQSVDGSRVSGDVTQVEGVGGDADLGPATRRDPGDGDAP